MTENNRKKFAKIVLLLLILNLFSFGKTFGQIQENASFSSGDSDIFPFSSGFSEEPNPLGDENKINSEKYSEDVLDVTNQGLVDAQGNPVVEVSESSEPVNVAQEDEIKIDDSSIETFNQNVQSQDSLDAYKQSVLSNLGTKVEFTKHRLQDLKGTLVKETKNFGDLAKQINDIEEQMEPTRRQIVTLQDEIALLNDQLNFAKKKIQNTDNMIAEKEILLRGLMKDYEESEIKIKAQKEIVLNYIILVYNEQQNYLNFDDGSSSTLKLLLADNSVSENLLGLEYSSVLEQTGRKVFYDLYNKQVELKDKKERIENERIVLDGLRVSQEREKQLLAEAKTSKNDLLNETQGREEEYQKMLAKSKQQQLESAMAISNIKDNIESINQKLATMESSIQNEQVVIPASEQPVETQNQVSEIKTEKGDEMDTPVRKIEKFKLAWPVPPKAITAYFHDPNYPKRWGVHQAVDIRAKQYTEIHAPANGYVFQTKDNGMGYSYIILAHKNKLITVYGHVSKILVKTGTTVKKGDLIGLSGGTPGTKGAGWQTTGPHLHFEVWYNGKQVDPLDWIPVMELPAEYIPARFIR